MQFTLSSHFCYGSIGEGLGRPLNNLARPAAKSGPDFTLKKQTGDQIQLLIGYQKILKGVGILC
jgi:hypothetical protein